MNEETLDLMEEAGTWRSRPVEYVAGTFEQLISRMPEFELQDFKAGENSLPNPYLKTVVRKPIRKMEQPVPVGTVSPNYMLVQHRTLAEQCMIGITQEDMLFSEISRDELRCELGLTELGEWINLQIYFPKQYNITDLKDKHPVSLRLECFNSVDGWSRLVVLLGWFRMVCSNGMVIGETKMELRQIHNASIDLGRIRFDISSALNSFTKFKTQLKKWDETEVDYSQLASWINGPLTCAWGIKAALRVYHICRDGWDVSSEPFATGKATEKLVRRTREVPGATAPAESLYDVCQAMTWVAKGRTDPEERLAWQSQVPELLAKLQTGKSK